MKVLIGYLTLVLAVSQLAKAQQVNYVQAGPPPSWRVIGKADANLKADHDGIIVQGPYNNFHHVKLKVTSATIKLIKMVITYDNGAPDNIETLNKIPQGGESQVIDLRRVGGRKIKKIDFWYDTGGTAKGKANVIVLGMT
ncbi:hypothetical protein ACFGVR_20015 [Mucilaginibacter sp. AW1-3]